MKVSLVRGVDLAGHGTLLASMFRARKRLFDNRLAHDVHVDEQGWETDGLDGDQALYIMLGKPDGDHVASLRLLPSTGKTALGDAFSALLDGVALEDESVWECTRLTLDVAPGDRGSEVTHLVTAQLLLALWETAHHAGIRLITGAFDAATIPALARAGWVPELIGQSQHERGAVYLGYWEVNEDKADSIRRAGDLNERLLDDEMRDKAAALIES